MLEIRVFAIRQKSSSGNYLHAMFTAVKISLVCIFGEQRTMSFFDTGATTTAYFGYSRDYHIITCGQVLRAGRSASREEFAFHGQMKSATHSQLHRLAVQRLLDGGTCVSPRFPFALPMKVSVSSSVAIHDVSSSQCLEHF